MYTFRRRREAENVGTIVTSYNSVNWQIFDILEFNITFQKNSQQPNNTTFL